MMVNMRRSLETEQSHENEISPTVVYLGQLEKYKLGNPDTKIKSNLAEAPHEEIVEYGENMGESLVRVTDETHIGCIDGRCAKCNADGSEPEVRRRQVGGTGAILETALNIGADVFDTLEEDAGIGKMVAASEGYIEDTLQIRRSAHLGTCGGVKGAVAHQRAIATNPNIMAATKDIMDIPAVKEFVGFGFNEKTGEKVQEQSAKTADLMEAAGWDEKKYVEGVKDAEAAGVEELEGEHEEPAIVVIINTKPGTNYSLSDDEIKKRGLKPPFVWNLDLTKEIAEALSTGQGSTVMQQAFTHLVAKHLAVANDLPGPKTPLYAIVI